MPYHHGDLRTALIEAGRDHLRTEPRDTLSLRTLAQHLGVSHGAPRRHFATREELLVAVAAECLSELVEAQRTAVDPEDPPHRRLIAAGMAYVTWAEQNPHAFALAFDPAINSSGNAPAALAEVVAVHAEWFTDLVAATIEEGVLSPGIPAPVHFAHLWGVVQGLAVLRQDARLPRELVLAALHAALGLPEPA